MNFERGFTSLSKSVTAVDADVGAGHVCAGIRQQECDGTHKIDGLAHLTLRDKRGPLLLEVWLFVKDLLGTICGFLLAAVMRDLQESNDGRRYLQSSQHITGGNTVYTDAGVGPLDGK